MAQMFAELKSQYLATAFIRAGQHTLCYLKCDASGKQFVLLLCVYAYLNAVSNIGMVVVFNVSKHY